MDTTVEKFTCVQCSEPFERTVIILHGRRMAAQTRCKRCIDESTAENEQQAGREADQAMLYRWERICPVLYRQTDIARLPKVLQDLVKCPAKEKGVGIVGSAGQGKTRAAYLMLKNAFYSGQSVAAATATGFARASADQFSDNRQDKAEARDILNKLRKSGVVLIDDIGKCKFTDRTELEFYDLLEHRTSHGLPMIWTANANAGQLLSMLSDDRGEPILRRLSEFCTVVKV